MREEFLPYDKEAEAVVLGASILDPRHMEAVTAELGPGHFHAPLHRAVFGALVAMVSDGRQVTLVSICKHIGEALPKLGGPAAVASLIDGLPRFTEIDRWIRPLRDKAVLRSVIHAAREMESEALIEGAEGATVLDRAQSALLAVSRVGSNDGFVDNKAAVKRALTELELMAQSVGGIFGIGTGLPDLDAVTGGFRGGDLVLLGAETSGGKSALALQIAEQCVKDGKNVALFSLEMSEVSLFIRRICGEARVGTEYLRYKRGTELEKAWDKVVSAAGEISGRNLWVDPSSFQTVAQLTTRARRKQIESGLDMVIVDYIQLVHGITGKKYDSRAQEVGEVAYGLLALAKSLNVPVIAPVQFSRAATTRPDKRPQLSDLKESSGLEQASELVILVWHEDTKGKFDLNAMVSNAELIVAKNRRGRKGVASVQFNKALSRFDSVAREDVEWHGQLD